MSSSAADSIKQAAEEPAADEPSTKKLKVVEGENGSEDTGEATASTTTTKNKDLETNNNKKNAIKTPSKARNGDAAKGPGDPEGNADDAGGDSSVSSSEPEFDPKITQLLGQVESIQYEICNLNEKASEEILKVEQKFNKLRRPHFEKRNELLKEVPNFWLTSLANHPIIAPLIENVDDEDCLHYMVNLDVEEFEDIKSGYRLKLYFVENPYITNEVIVKEFRLVSSDDLVSTSTPIEYKDTPQGRNLRNTVEHSIAQYRRHRGRPGATHHSFFAWLAERNESGSDETAEILKDQIWPNPMEFFFASDGVFASGTDTSDDEDEEIDNIEEEEIDDEEEGVIVEGADFSELDDDDDDDDDDDEDDDEGEDGEVAFFEMPNQDQ